MKQSISIIPRRLELWLEKGTLKYRVEGKTLTPDKLDFLKSNKEHFISLLGKSNSGRIHILPLAQNQKALWFLQTANPEIFAYNISLTCQVQPKLDVEKVQSAIFHLAKKYASLRTIFSALPGSGNLPCQVISENPLISIECLERDGMSMEDIRSELTIWYRRPFDLSEGPLFRTCIVRCGDSDVLSFCMHHIICDAISLRNFCDEFIALYSGYEAPVFEEIPLETWDYEDFVIHQADFLNSKEGSEQLEHWKKQLGTEPKILKLPTVFDRPVIHRFHGSTHLFKIDGSLYGKLKSYSKENDVAINLTLLSAFAYCLSKEAGQTEVILGIPAAARTSGKLEKIFGYLINLLPFRCEFASQLAFKDFLLENKNNLYRALENQDIPFPLLVEHLSPPRDLSRTPVFQVIFNFLNRKALGSLLHFLGTSEDYFSWGALNVRPFKIFDQEGQVDLTLEIIEDTDCLLAALKYNTDLFDEQYILHFTEVFNLLLEEIVAGKPVLADWLPDSTLSTVALAEPEMRICITGTFTTEPVQPALEFWLKEFGLKTEIVFPGYNQVYSQLLNPSSEFRRNKKGYNVLFIRLEDWFGKDIDKAGDTGFEQNLRDFTNALDEALGIVNEAKYIIVFCPPSPGVSADQTLSARVVQAENQLAAKIGAIGIGSLETLESYGIRNFYEELGEHAGHIPYTKEFFISAATLIARKIHITQTPPFKAIAVDCDNTLWKGVVGEDGPLGIQLGPTEKALQEFLIRQHDAGVLICLCSKNREEDVFEVFDQNREMLLQRKHISFHRINWNPKSVNLLQLASEINIGLDSFVFIDDNPIECEEVRSQLPGVLVLQLPSGGLSSQELQNTWIFDRQNVTEEDRQRAVSYREEASRKIYRSSVASYGEFIRGLDLKLDIRKFQEENLPRISQLTFRTNQFNFTTLRRSESELLLLMQDSKYECFQVHVSDRFGDYGLVGVLIATLTPSYTVDTFLLSCRVLGKGVENRLVAFLGERAIQRANSFVDFRIADSGKNIPALKFMSANFVNYELHSGKVHVYHIPAEVASRFSFEPESFIPAAEEEKSLPNTPLKLDLSVQNRNRFFTRVFENFLKLDGIRNILYPALKNSEALSGNLISSSGKTEKAVLSVWREVLNKDSFGMNDNFFDIGGHSVLIPQIVIQLQKRYDIRIGIVDLFQYPSVKSLSAFIDGRDSTVQSGGKQETAMTGIKPGHDIAIIGMSGRFSGVRNLEEYWDAILKGKETISHYTREELLAKNVDPRLLDDPHFVRANGTMPGADLFDASFFGVPPKEADFMDPQHRVFLEVCYEALENAGYATERYDGEIGLFAGCGMNNYLVKNLFQHEEGLRLLGEFQTIINNNSDYFTTRVSYKLNLTGPSINIQTACSTSLVAVHQACQSLRTHQCDIALAGGAFIQIPHAEGYMFEPGGIFSPDGHCRPFDSKADGTLFGEGAGVVVLKELGRALEDGDNVLAIIKGSAINNDGSGKIGYMAPSVNGQAKVIRKALEDAGVDPLSISYIEAHGTGTNLGDPIEVNALRKVFESSGKDSFCSLGSVKGNIGHLDAAAGVAGIIKLVLMFQNGMLPPLVHFKRPNPEIQMNGSPFYFNTESREWKAGDNPRRAGISSFGIGGTNAHCILEEPPAQEKKSTGNRLHLLPITAKSEQALNLLSQRVIQFAETSGKQIADISTTLQLGRNHYKHRRMLYAEEYNGTLKVWNQAVSAKQDLYNPKVVFLYNGQGSQFAGMFRDLYNMFKTFRDVLDIADRFLHQKFGIEILPYVIGEASEQMQQEAMQTAIAQPLLFTVQYGLSRLLQDFGIVPHAVLGHSIGEYAAATISGVFQFEEALNLVAWRGKLMQDQPPGAMLSVPLAANEINRFTSDKVSIALRNAPGSCVLAGEKKELELVAEMIAAEEPGIQCSWLQTSHAFHSRMMKPVLEPFAKLMEKVSFGDCKIGFISSMSGKWMSMEELASASYWTSQIIMPVNFSDGVQELLKDENTCFLEIGPGTTLTTLLSLYDSPAASGVIPVSRHSRNTANDVSVFLQAVGKAWARGVNIHWEQFYREEKRYRISLPNYPFESKRFWIDPRISFNYFYETGKNELTGPENHLSTTPFEGEKSEDNSLQHDRPALDNAFVPPANPTEMQLAGIWEKLLGMKSVGMEDDFFMLGGHSLLASQVITRIREQYGIRISLEQFFKTPTIRALAAGIAEDKPRETTGREIIPGTRSGKYPLSPDQERLWIINRINPSNPAYNIPFTYKLKGILREDIFAESLTLLFRRHEILRSHIRAERGKPFISLLDFEQVPVGRLDFSSLDKQEAENRIQSFLTGESRTPFDIENGPLFRIFLVKLTPDEYIFHLTVQHMVFDGWSWGIFANELGKIYNALLHGKEIPLAPMRLQYYDIAGKIKEHLAEDILLPSVQFWKEKLKGHPTEINFPYDFTRKQDLGGNGRRERLVLPRELASKVRNLCQKENATVFMFLLSVFGTLLHKYSGDRDICIGVPTANRSDSKIEEIIGLFVNTIILRMRFEEHQTFRHILNITRRETLDALAHGDLPFEKLVEELQPGRKVNLNPITQILFAYQNTPRPPLEMEGITSSRILIQETVSPMDITFYAWDIDGMIEGEIEYNIELLSQWKITGLKENFLFLLEELTEFPEKKLCEVSVISSYSLAQLDTFNNTAHDVPQCMIQRFFEEQSLRLGDKTALITGNRSLTYAELDGHANQLAHHLRSLELREGGVVGILLERTEEMVIAILGVLKAGYTYLPLDPMFPRDRIDYMFRDSQAVALITQTSLKNNLALAGDIPLLLVESLHGVLQKYPLTRPEIKEDPSALAYIIYTSGSTGKPKGVKVPHRGVVNLIGSMTRVPGMSEKDVVLAVVTMSFDMSVYELFVSLSTGATIVLAGSDQVTDGRVLSDLIERYAVSILQATPSLFYLLLASGWKGRKELKALCGGETLSGSIVTQILPRVKELWNCYGPTETTVYSTCMQIVDPEQKVLIGKPIDNTVIWILDENDIPLPPGVTGQIAIGGIGVTQGYLNQEELTREKFILHKNGTILYKTGDTGRFDQDGNIEHLGRIDNQIKIRGFRIEPGEIESLLSQVNGINEAVVKLQEFGAQDERLVAFLDVRESFDEDSKSLNRLLREKLPSYMFPSEYCIMKAFPRTSNGKIDRKALVFVPKDTSGDTPRQDSKLTDTEYRIRDIWCKHLKKNDISIHDNFFDVGGNSLLAISIFSHMEEEFNVKLNLRIFFDSPRIQDLAEVLDINLRNNKTQGQPPEAVKELKRIITGEI